MCIVWILCSESFFTFILSPHFILSTFGVFIVIHVRVFKCKYVNITTDNIILSITVDIDGGAKTEQARRCRCCGWAAAGAEAEDDLPSQGEACCRGELVPSPLLRAHGGHADAAVHRPVTRHRDPLPWSHLKVSRKRNERNISTANWNGSKSKTPKAQIKFISNYFQ